LASATPAPEPRTIRTARTAQRSSPVRGAPGNPAAADAAAVAVAQAPEPQTHGPFQPPVDAITTRPWPRAVLPDASAAGAFTVGLESSAPASGFYPFEPQAGTEPGQDGAAPPQP
jgi:hypothetical protein